MNKLLTITFFALLASITGHAQTMDDAKKHIYYQRYNSAKAVLQSIIKSGAPSPDAWYWLGEIYLKEKKTDSAKIVLEEGAHFYSTNNFSMKKYPLNYIGWAHMLMDSGLVAEAKTQMDELLKASKYKNAEALLAVAKANIESKNGDAAWAVTLLEKAAKRDKDNAEINLRLGDAYRKLINGGNAVLSYDKAIAENAAYAEAWYKKGLIYKTQNNTEIYVGQFTRAVQADSTYAPALFELYAFYFYRDIKKAGELLKGYIKYSDPDIEQQYLQTDYFFAIKNYQLAINEAGNIIATQRTQAKPRLYKLIAYCKAALGDSAAAEKNMDIYFAGQKKEDVVAKDYELMAKLTEANYDDKAKALEWYKKALTLQNEKEEKLSYMSSLAEIQKELGNREREAVWRESIYKTKDRPSNLDIYNWGIALYMADNYQKADSVFNIYSEKYPDQIHGHLWQARCNALLDSTMEKGLAVKHYEKVIEVTLNNQEKYKSAILRAYTYLGTYEANITKNYPKALDYFEKILELEPTDSNAQKNAAVIKQWIATGDS